MVDINRRSFKDVDWVLLLAPIALTLLGCLGIISTEGDEITRSSHLGFSLFQKQLIALAIGVVIAIVVMLTDYRKVIITIAPFFYAFVMVLLVMVLRFFSGTLWFYLQYMVGG